MFDVFYQGPKPNIFSFEKLASSLEQAAELSRTRLFWFIDGQNDYTNFDFNYVPVPWEEQYVHVWADQHQQDGRVYLASKRNNGQWLFHNEPVRRLPVKEYWDIPEDVDCESIDWSWCPDPMDPPYNYAFSNQWNCAEHELTAVYRVPGATQTKFIEDRMVRVLPTYDYWKTNYEQVDFDYSWRPNPKDPPYIYIFGNQWYPAELMPTVEYHTPGATEKKFVNSIQAKLPERHDNHWHTLEDCEWDYSWLPDPGDPPYIYVFGNQWYPAEIMPTVKYTVEGATEIKYMDYPRAKLVPTTEHWVIKEDVPFEFDYSWCPDPGDPPYIYVFGNNLWEGERSATIEYHVPGATERKYIGDVRATFEQLDIFFIDYGNSTAQTRYDLLQNHYTVNKVRYANSVMETIKRCANRAKTNRFWVISSKYDYTDFNFDWQPEPWQQGMTHVFPSQHQKWSDTFLINRWEFERHSKWANGLEQFPNLNFVTNQQVRKVDNRYTVYYVDHGNNTSQHQYEYLRADRVQGVDIVKTRFVDNYLDTFKRIMSTAETEYVWIINSICDYSQFDFTWEPEPWQKEMIHVFPSDHQDRGDTFYIHVESFKTQMFDLALLDWFNVINYCDEQRVSRWDIPVHEYHSDNLVKEIKNYEFKEPYALFTQLSDLKFAVAPCLWAEKDRTVLRCSRAGSTALVPRDIKRHLKTQIYDYPYIDKSEYQLNDYLSTSKNHESPDLDIVFISNGEPDEEEMYDYTCYTTNRRVKWIRGVNGRVAAYQAAAEVSTTPWFFAVFAKLRVDPKFDWFWMPDMFQEPKHYIFNSHNPVNGLEYGHQGMIAYNKELVLQNHNPGIDFTLTQAHEAVPILSGVAEFNQSAWMTWRTAFREVVKLKHFQSEQPTFENEHRLKTWLTMANGAYAEWCLKGANDAVEYYNSVNGEYSKLMLTFEWQWLKDYYTVYRRYE
jgi:hypothetical protein